MTDRPIYRCTACGKVYFREGWALRHLTSAHDGYAAVERETQAPRRGCGTCLACRSGHDWWLCERPILAVTA